MVRRAWCLVLLLGAGGCAMTAQGFNRNLLEARLADEAVKDTEPDIQEVRKVRPQLTFPCRIAVALRGSSGDWRWTGKDKQQMEAWAEAMRREGIATDVVFMSNMFAQGDGLKEMRVAAARYGADALLFVKGGALTDAFYNPACVFNATIIGGFVVPASHRNALFVIESGLVDVSNGCLYASVEAEGEGKMVRPTFLIEDKDAIARAKHEALEAFGPELLKRMRALRASAPAPQVAQPIAPPPIVQR